jgi:Uncharacterised protein conserved in bacteria (DUF2313)
VSGKFAPFPERFGGSTDSILEVLLRTLQENLGDAFSTDDDAYVTAELVADSRALGDLFNSIERLRSQWDPDRMTDFLPRWEQIFRLSPAPDASLVSRRAAVKLRMQAIGKSGNQQRIYDVLSTILGDALVSMVPGNTTDQIGSIPGGLAIPGGPTLVDGPFCSWVAALFIHVEKPSSMSAKDFENAKADVRPILNKTLAAWTDYVIYQNSSDGVRGFKLDEPDLDIEAFA